MIFKCAEAEDETAGTDGRQRGARYAHGTKTGEDSGRGGLRTVDYRGEKVAKDTEKDV